jgi:hypothetical protein
MAPAAPASPRAIRPSGSVPQAVVLIGSAPGPTSPSSAVVIPSGWNSAIVPDFPKLFKEFKQKQFTLLWRGSRDGFRGDEFHNRCDGHANTLTVILDMKGNIFGGFTPVEWVSRHGNKADPSLKSFIFTLKNPHNVPARSFRLKAEQKFGAILCRSGWGPCFWDILVWEDGDPNYSHTQYFGEHYTNDTGLDGKTFFTGTNKFQAKEIEVFEITN